jgi:hypothetical protein
MRPSLHVDDNNEAAGFAPLYVQERRRKRDVEVVTKIVRIMGGLDFAGIFLCQSNSACGDYE